MQIFLIRHGSTLGNLERRYVGSTDEELTAKAVQELRLARGRYPVPELVFVSPLKRCRQTADLLFPEAEKIVLPDLRECEFGAFEYQNYQELQGNSDYQRWIDSGGTLAFPGGESREEFCDRCCAAFVQGCRDAMKRNCASAAFVVHGGTIMAVLDRFARPHRDYFEWQVKNGKGFAGELRMSSGGGIGTVRSCSADGGVEDARKKSGESAIYAGEASRTEDAQDARKKSGDTPADSSLQDCVEIRNIAALPDDAEAIGIEDLFVMKKNKKLRCGYTTGTCAAAAAKAAAEMLLTGRVCRWSDLMTPKGVALHLPVLEQRIAADEAVCAVRKYAGDDRDATDGLLIYAKAERVPEETDTAGRRRKSYAESVQENDKKIERVVLDGGVGVGRVTKPGLEQPVGAAAINRVPREMIVRAVEQICELYEYPGRLRITIFVPRGEAVANHTFNPHIGIMGGISILGTSGIVVPMSEEALIASIRVEMRQKHENGEEYLLITPGNYGADFIRRRELSQSLDAEHSMKCSNYVGETLDMASELGVKGILFVAHIGKFIKVSGGVMNTHSAHADCRAELIAAQALRAIANQEKKAASEVAVRLLNTNTTEEAVGILKEAHLLEATMVETLKRIQFHLQKRCQGALQTEVVLFSNQYGYLGETDGAEEMMEKIIAQNKRLAIRTEITD